MQKTKLEEDINCSIRTQISLTPSLKRYIDRQIEKSGISMSEFIRQSLIAVAKEKNKFQQKKSKVLKAFLAADKNDNEWGSSNESITKWGRSIRKDL